MALFVFIIDDMMRWRLFNSLIEQGLFLKTLAEVSSNHARELMLSSLDVLRMEKVYIGS
jgi:hypothetical protein